MNIHHLELFYYVARHGGITEAVRNIPYGIQQPAVSGQVGQLEEYLGVVLFQRRPFALTPAGERLYRFIDPFFSQLDSLSMEIQRGRARQLRIGASTVILRDHLPALFKRLREKFPDLKVSLREGYQAELEQLLLRDEIDLAVTLIEQKSPSGIHSLAMLKLPLTLLVEVGSPITDLSSLWSQGRILTPLICLPAAEAVCKLFQRGLTRLGVDWFPTIETSSIDLVQTYVAGGLGVGLSVLVPKATLPENVRAIPLSEAEFGSVQVGALWRGKRSALLEVFLDELQLGAKRLR
jgi:DNA-binding transcriptional LysR family regulator